MKPPRDPVTTSGGAWLTNTPRLAEVTVHYPEKGGGDMLIGFRSALGGRVPITK